MGRQRMKGCKYQRVTQQQKYIFLKLCITQQQSIHEAAHNAGIQYSTAKTILFFHKKNYKNYSSYHVPEPDKQSQTSSQQASWKTITIDLEGQSSERQPIEIIVNSKAKIKKQRKNVRENKEFTSYQQYQDAIKIEHDSKELLKLVDGEVKKEESQAPRVDPLQQKRKEENLSQVLQSCKQQNV